MVIIALSSPLVNLFFPCYTKLQQSDEGAAVIRVDVLGVGFDALTMEEAVAEGLRLARADGCSYAVTPNPELVLEARRDAAFREILNGAELVLPDGVGILYGARILGRPLPDRVPGIDFAARLTEELARHGLGLFLYGAKPGVAERAGVRLCQRYPGLRLCGTRDGYSPQEEAAAVIRASGADVVFVCLGAPKQERWMARWGGETGAALLIGLGGSLDIFAGDTRRAPPLLRRLGLEWFYRLVTQPSRFGRMARLPLFLWYAAAARRGGE